MPFCIAKTIQKYYFFRKQQKAFCKKYTMPIIIPNYTNYNKQKKTTNLAYYKLPIVVFVDLPYKLFQLVQS